MSWYGKYEEEEETKPKKKHNDTSGPFYGKGFNNGLDLDKIISDDDPFYGKGFNDGK